MHTASMAFEAVCISQRSRLHQPSNPASFIYLHNRGFYKQLYHTRYTSKGGAINAGAGRCIPANVNPFSLAYCKNCVRDWIASS